MFRQNQRKHVFINRPFQGRFVFYIVITLLLIASASAVSIYFGIWNSVLNNFSSESIHERLTLSTRLREYQDARFSEENKEDWSLALLREIDLFASREREILNETLATTYKNLFPLFIALLFFVGWGTIFITHKIAGPLFRFGDSLKKLRDGKLFLRVHLRKHDEAQELVPLFNDCISHWDASLFRIKEAAHQLTNLMTEKNFPVECLEVLAQITHELDQYETTQKLTKNQ